MTRTICDIIIVGAGVMGCATAFHLSKRRNLRVIVVEKGSIASGMTKRSGALIHAQHDYEAESQLARISLHGFQNWKDLTGASCGFTQTGCTIVSDDSHAATLREQADRFQKMGGKNQILSMQDLKELEPNVRFDDLSVAVHEPEAGYADPVQATQTLAARAKEAGVVFKTGTMVKGIRIAERAGRISGVETTTGDIEALSLVLMIGAWTDRLLKPLGVQIGIQNTRTHVVFFERPTELKQGHSAFIDWTTGAHLRPHPFGLTMGGLNQSQIEENNPDSFDESVPPSLIADVQERIAVRLPVMEKARYIRGHAGVYDTTSDGRPVISRVPGIEGLFVATGFSNQGFAFAPAVGACVSEMVTEGEASTVDLSELGFDRLRK